MMHHYSNHRARSLARGQTTASGAEFSPTSPPCDQRNVDLQLPDNLDVVCVLLVLFCYCRVAQKGKENFKFKTMQ